MLYEKIICGPVPFLQEFNNLAILYQTLQMYKLGMKNWSISFYNWIPLTSYGFPL